MRAPQKQRPVYLMKQSCTSPSIILSTNWLQEKAQVWLGRGILLAATLLCEASQALLLHSSQELVFTPCCLCFKKCFPHVL